MPERLPAWMTLLGGAALGVVAYRYYARAPQPGGVAPPRLPPPPSNGLPSVQNPRAGFTNVLNQGMGSMNGIPTVALPAASARHTAMARPKFSPPPPQANGTASGNHREFDFGAGMSGMGGESF